MGALKTALEFTGYALWYGCKFALHLWAHNDDDKIAKKKAEEAKFARERAEQERRDCEMYERMEEERKLAKMTPDQREIYHLKKENGSLREGIKARDAKIRDLKSDIDDMDSDLDDANRTIRDLESQLNDD